mgnify:FL=1|jgi:hypothetical protein
MYTRRIVIDKVNKHINAMYPYTGEYIIDQMTLQGEMSQNLDNVLDKAYKMYRKLINGNKQVLDK